MYWLDSTIIAMLAAAAVLGAYSGLLMQLFRLVGFAAALYAAIVLNAGVADWLRQAIMRGTEEQSCTFAAYGIVFLGIYLGILVATLLLERGIRAARLQYLNRTLGALLATVKMGLLMGAVCYGLQQVPYPPASEMLTESAAAPMLAKGFEQALAAVPAEYKSDLSKKWSQVRDALPVKADKGYPR